MLRLIEVKIDKYPEGVTGICLFCSQPDSDIIVRVPLPRALDQYAHTRCYHQWVKDYTELHRRGVIFRDGEQK